nr:hypothetical protein CFP56_39007 [Quercus suber]
MGAITSFSPAASNTLHALELSLEDSKIEASCVSILRGLGRRNFAGHSKAVWLSTIDDLKYRMETDDFKSISGFLKFGQVLWVWYAVVAVDLLSARHKLDQVVLQLCLESPLLMRSATADARYGWAFRRLDSMLFASMFCRTSGHGVALITIYQAVFDFAICVICHARKDGSGVGPMLSLCSLHNFEDHSVNVRLRLSMSAAKQLMGS